MASIKLTVKRLYNIEGERMVRTCATARIYVGETLIATETIEGMTESPVSKVIHHQESDEKPLRVEWDCDGIADMVVYKMREYICSQPDE